MISFDEAQRIILENAAPLGTTRRVLGKLLHSVLAQSVTAPFDLPRFDNSAVDGFGVRWADIETASQENPISLRLVGTIQAGDSGKINLKPGEAVRILTGAPVPPSVDAVVMQEFCQEIQAGGTAQIQVATDVERGENIRRRGEEFRKRHVILNAGMRISPPVIGLLATLGQASATVYRKPKIGLISTGNELVEPGKALKPGQIYDSNTYALSAALQGIGLESVRVYRAKDEPAATRRVFEKALKENDVLISLGGISVGAFDFVKDVAEGLSIETLFWRIAMKPGKPVYFGKLRRKLIFGLPGNPVSALVTYHQLVQPALLKLLGVAEETRPRLQARLQGALRKKIGRQEFVRGRLQYDGEQFSVTPTLGQDSHMLGGLAAANCLIDFPSDLERVAETQWIKVDPLSWTR
jgi:molybdopterin molybdotransferase